MFFSKPKKDKAIPVPQVKKAPFWRGLFKPQYAVGSYEAFVEKVCNGMDRQAAIRKLVIQAVVVMGMCVLFLSHFYRGWEGSLPQMLACGSSIGLLLVAGPVHAWWIWMLRKEKYMTFWQWLRPAREKGGCHGD